MRFSSVLICSKIWLFVNPSRTMHPERHVTAHAPHPTMIRLKALLGKYSNGNGRGIVNHSTMVNEIKSYQREREEYEKSIYLNTSRQSVSKEELSLPEFRSHAQAYMNGDKYNGVYRESLAEYYREMNVYNQKMEHYKS